MEMNKKEEVKKELECLDDYSRIYLTSLVDKDTPLMVLKKPEKANSTGDPWLGDLFMCPKCRGGVGMFYYDTWLDRYCAHCGQAIKFHIEDE